MIEVNFSVLEVIGIILLSVGFGICLTCICRRPVTIHA